MSQEPAHPPDRSDPEKPSRWHRFWLQVQRLPRLSIFLLDWMVGVSQRLLFLGVMAAVGYSLWQIIEGGNAQRDQVLELVRLLNECWKVLVVVAILAFRREISSLMARIISLGKNGVQFAVSEAGEDLGMEDSPVPPPKRKPNGTVSQPGPESGTNA